MSCSSDRFHPARKAQSQDLSREHLVGNVASEKDHASRNRFDPGDRIALVDQQLSAISLIPTIGQVEDHRKLPAVIILEPIDVFLVKGTLLIDSVLEFKGPDARIAGTVEVLHELVDLPQECPFALIGRFCVQPVDVIVSDSLDDLQVLPVSYSSRMEALLLVMRQE